MNKNLSMARKSISTPSTEPGLLLVLKNRLEFLICLYPKESLSQFTISLKYDFSKTGLSLDWTNFLSCSCVGQFLPLVS